MFRKSVSSRVADVPNPDDWEDEEDDDDEACVADVAALDVEFI